MEELAPCIDFWPIQSAPFLKVFELSQANAAFDSISTRNDAGVTSESFVTLRPGRGLDKPTTRGSFSKQPARSTRGGRTCGQSILIVDDVVDVTEMIGLFLKHAGFDVTTANSADSALQLTAETHFDLIISDIGMPDMNGYELAESLRNREDYSNTPLIAVTGYTEYDDRGRSLQAGFDAHLTKPINPSQLLELISQLLG